MKMNPENGSGQPSSRITASTSAAFCRKRRIVLLSLAALAAWLGQAQAVTYVSGDVCNATWTPTGNPYIANGNVRVPTGCTLTIQPGVTFIIGAGLGVDVEGTISALGTAAQKITIRGASPSLYWDRIYINYTGSADSTFVNCNISDATNAVYLYAYNTGAGILAPQFSGCQFSNCIQTCIYGYSSAPYGPWNGNSVLQAILNPVVRNCRFRDASVGVHFVADGSTEVNRFPGQGMISPTIANCLFTSLSDAGVWFEAAKAAYPPYTSSPDVENSIFVQCSTAVRRSGVQTMFQNDNAAYNCLYNNQTNFDGYPAGVFGTICCQNANGTWCDLMNNILTNSPTFCETTNYTLSASSPCIDAGNPAGAYLDNCFAAGPCQPGSLGTSVNDIGIWGGPQVCVGTTNGGGTNFTLAAQRFVGVTINPSIPGHYRLEYTPTLGSTNIWTQITNVSLLSTPWTYIDFDYPAVGKRFYRGVLLP